MEQLGYTLHKTNITRTPEKRWLRDKPFLLGMAIFRGYLSLKEGRWLIILPQKKTQQRFRLVLRLRQDTDFTMKDAMRFEGQLFWKKTLSQGGQPDYFFWDYRYLGGKTKNKLEKLGNESVEDCFYFMFFSAVWLQFHQSFMNCQDLPSKYRLILHSDTRP